MAFLFQDQNQGIRNDIGHAQSAAAATVLFHPDFNRRLRNHTESADPLFHRDFRKNFPKKKALAGLGYVTLTAGGDFHPALRTSAARNGRPDTNMTKGRGLSKHLQYRESACPHADGTGQRLISGRTSLQLSACGRGSAVPLRLPFDPNIVRWGPTPLTPRASR